jgi:hypothetical protein
MLNKHKPLQTFTNLYKPSQTFTNLYKPENAIFVQAGFSLRLRVRTNHAAPKYLRITKGKIVWLRVM